LKTLGYNSYRTVQKPFISQENAKQRMAFAETHENWSQDDWSCVVFSDESVFNLVIADGRSWIRRKENDIIPEMLQFTEPFPNLL